MINRASKTLCLHKKSNEDSLCFQYVEKSQSLYENEMIITSIKNMEKFFEIKIKSICEGA